MTLTGNQTLADIDVQYAFADSVIDNGDGTYSLDNDSVFTIKQSEWPVDHDLANGKYTCGDNSLSCNTPKYVPSTSISTLSYVNYTTTIRIGKSRSGLQLQDSILARKADLVQNPSNYSEYKYTCNTNGATCTASTLQYIEDFTNVGYTYYNSFRYYGSSVTWDGSKYIFDDFKDVGNADNLSTLEGYHYVCLDSGYTTCTNVGYAYAYDSTNQLLYYVSLDQGVTDGEAVVSNALTSNTKNSTIKNAIDAWYKNYMLDYSSYIEDTIYCNERTLSATSGFDSEGGFSNTVEVSFVGNSFECKNTTDRFSISNDQAKLTYPVGLLTKDEVNLINSSSILKSSNSYWLMTPSTYDASSNAINYSVINNYGVLNTANAASSTSTMGGLRPVITLKYGIDVTTGDGSMTYPFIVDTTGE